MIIAKEVSRVGVPEQVTLDDRISKEDLLKATTSKDIPRLNTGNKSLVAASLLENFHAYAIEDEDGMLHIMSIGAVIRMGNFKDNVLDKLPEVDYKVPVTKFEYDPFADFSDEFDN